MKTLSVMMVVLMLLASTTNTEAQRKYQLSKNSIESLKNGITSKNNGLRRSAIYMAGFYEIREVATTLKRGCLKRGSLFYYILRFSKKSLRLKLVPTYDLRFIYSSPYVKF
jgi:hypothetical protein